MENNEKIDIESLSEEQLNKIREDIVNSFRDVDTKNPEELLKYIRNNYITDIPDLETPKKLIDCSHEIVFTIRASVLEENEKGETIGCKEVCQKDYHIPVPPKKDYNTYMETFFKYLENCITYSAKNSANNTEDKNG